ncbi:hypothetical protein SAMN05216388_101735 [Halorientalis persicus]|uniref:Uncharacterized protein n=1 Tax=Halorientalis persicus TaxID=1367881 RepID=A0A1H8RUU8_9EURY|nr:bZIP transcription factor [Halorientalis persicus]SEO69928.1 hypothetical protein SAMN05216388_101735 [Halorientalis persicus]
MTDGVEIEPEDALEVAQRALARVSELEERLDETEAENAELKERLTVLELRYDDLDGGRSYDDLDRNGRVGRVREHAFERATEGHGHATLDYNDVMWSVFDGEPSADYCYKLMRLAADATGFTFRDPDGKGKELRVNADAARQGVSFSSANKTAQEGGR